MNFGLPEEIEEMRDLIARWVGDRLEPRAGLSQTHRLHMVPQVTVEGNKPVDYLIHVHLVGHTRFQDLQVAFNFLELAWKLLELSR